MCDASDPALCRNHRPQIQNMGALAVNLTRTALGITNAAIRAKVAAVAAAHPNVTLAIYDNEAAGRALYARALERKFGEVDNVRTPCADVKGSLIAPRARVVSKCRDPQRHYFFDDIHPTSVVHEAFAVDVWEVRRAGRGGPSRLVIGDVVCS